MLGHGGGGSGRGPRPPFNGGGGGDMKGFGMMRVDDEGNLRAHA